MTESKNDATNKRALSKKAIIIIVSIISSLVVLAVVLTVSLYFTLRYDLSITATQVEDTQQINVAWDTSINVDEVKISVKTSDKRILTTVTISEPAAVAKGNITLNASYGVITVDVKTTRSNVRKQHTSQKINVYADEYVIAPLVATMPVTYFSLSLPEYTNNYSIPSFIWLQRGGAWDYANMPENVYMMPLGNYSDMSTYSDPYHMYDKTAAWIKELYEINPDSKFHLYYNDYHPWGWMQATVANNIPSANYDVTLLSDGTGSYAAFAEYLNGSNAVEQFDKMCTDYNRLKEQIAQKGKYTRNDRKLAVSTEQLRHYIFCMLKEETNVKLVLARDFVTNDMPKDNPMRPTFLEWISNADNPNRPIQIRSMYSLLQAMNDEEKVTIKNLYKFSDNMFEKAANENKKIMVFMGTRTDLEKDFDGLVKATMAYYGDEYVYYYKGHPGTPTQMDSAKAKRLDKLGLIDVDSTISAEIIFFFNQEACASGYGTSTYNSLLDEQVCGVWNTSLDNVVSEYKDKVDYTLTKLTSSDSKYGSLANGTCYLFEFADTTNCDIAVYTESTNQIKYYKNANGQFTEVAFQTIID